jgi:hypothetical protein
MHNETHDDFVHDVLWTTLLSLYIVALRAYLKIRANLHLVRTNWIQTSVQSSLHPICGNRREAERHDKGRLHVNEF